MAVSAVPKAWSVTRTVVIRIQTKLRTTQATHAPDVELACERRRISGCHTTDSRKYVCVGRLGRIRRQMICCAKPFISHAKPFQVTLSSLNCWLDTINQSPLRTEKTFASSLNHFKVYGKPFDVTLSHFSLRFQTICG